MVWASNDASMENVVNNLYHNASEESSTYAFFVSEREQKKQTERTATKSGVPFVDNIY